MRIPAPIALGFVILLTILTLGCGGGDGVSEAEVITREGLAFVNQHNFETAIERFDQALILAPNFVPALINRGYTYDKLGQYERAIEEGHKAEKLRPNDQLVHTNLSLFYVKTGNKEAAEHHGLQSKIASWKQPGEDAAPSSGGGDGLQMAQPKAESFKLPGKFPDMPWRKNRNKGKAEGDADE